MTINIGVLLPHSKTYPTMGKEYLNGLKLGLGSSKSNCAFSIEGIGVGGDEKDLIDKAQKMVMQDDVQVITGLLGHVGIEKLVEYVKSMEVVLLYSDLGATIPLLTQHNEWSFCNSFELYKSAMLFGKYAPIWGYNNIAISSCYYDSGYGMISALEKTLYEAGGSFSGHFITPLHPRENEKDLMSEFVEAIKPDALYTIHSGVFAKEHVSFLAKNKIEEKQPVFSCPFGVDLNLINENKQSLVGSKCISPWFIEEERQSNSVFIELYFETYGKLPTPFALLGYENGLALNAGMGILENENLDINHLKNTLLKINIEGPRGEIEFVPVLNRTSYKQYLWEITENKREYKKEKRNKIDLELEGTILTSLTKQNGGWTNAYLCN